MCIYIQTTTKTTIIYLFKSGYGAFIACRGEEWALFSKTPALAVGSGDGRIKNFINLIKPTDFKPLTST